MGTTLARSVVFLALAAAFAGCTARPGLLRGGDAPAAPVAARPRDPMLAPSGWAHFSVPVRLRSETPSLTAIQAAERAAAEEAAARFAPAYGPRGEDGSPVPYAYDDAPPGYGAVYLVPGGAVPPGLRPPEPARPPSSPFAGPYASIATPASDVWDHRPGLSVGSGIYSRDANEPAHAHAHSHGHGR